MSLLRIVGLRGAIGAILLASLGGCGDSSMQDITVGGHLFSVPQVYFVEDGLSWLPTMREQHLRFVINPHASPQERMIVGVDPSQGTCQPNASPGSNMLEWACKLSRGVSAPVTGDYKPEKVFDRPGDKTQWGYRVPDDAGGYREVAGCFALSDGKAGLCHSINAYKDLIYSVGFRDSEIARLPQILAQVNGLLSSWEKAPH